MNSIALYFASGESLYVGAILLLVLMPISIVLHRQWLVRARNLAAWLALAMMVMACPPFVWIVDTIFLSAFTLWFIAVNRNSSGRLLLNVRIAATVVLFVLLFVLTAIELPHRAMPTISGLPSDHLVVIGDSISSGIDRRAQAWPAVLQQVTGAPVKNLAQPGALTIEAETMADQVTREDNLVLIEIGGNDLLTGVPAKEFSRALEALLSKLTMPGRTLVMFELPLLPHRIAYGQIQRRLAVRYGVALIPKRYFVDVIGGANATSDGLHLSDSGSRSMAALVSKALSSVLKPH